MTDHWSVVCVSVYFVGRVGFSSGKQTPGVLHVDFASQFVISSFSKLIDQRTGETDSKLSHVQTPKIMLRIFKTDEKVRKEIEPK